MTDLSLCLHWDSENMWLRVPRAVYWQFCPGRPIASANSRIDVINELLFLDADGDAKAFLEAYAKADDVLIAPVLGSSAIRNRLGIAERFDGAVSTIRSLPALIAGRSE